MKNQYFGDNKDLFKYDLILRVIEETRSLTHFTFIPMLTENNGKGHGEDDDRKKAKAGTNNTELVKFLDECRRTGKRDIKQLKSFLKKRIPKMRIYYGKDNYFSHEQREKYFEQIADELLPKSLVFVDPDTGLQIKSSSKEHILYSEVKTLYEHMDKHSILMIFQYFPHEAHGEYLHKRVKELKGKIIRDLPIYIDHIDDDEIIFFFLTKDKSIRESLSKLINGYRETYSELRVGNA
ncbi:MAG TPA: hypothetical protein G4N93_00210 [Dehalococcoidia bacterium]|nr:hypothetical protein [Dehalococcoidia bacterium]